MSYDYISLKLLESLGIDPKTVVAIRYEHHVQNIPTATIQLRITNPTELADGALTLETYEWQPKGKRRTIYPGTPEWDEWLKSLPRSEDEP